MDTRGAMTGTIEPWGVTTVTVRTFNDMPGTYDDRLDLTLSMRLVLNKTIATAKDDSDRLPVSRGEEHLRYD